MKRRPKFRVIYNSDPRFVVENHNGSILFLTDVDEQYFDSLCDALRFLNECTSPITQPEELLPELSDCPDVIQWILAEQNIYPEHLLVGNIELALERCR